MTAKEPVEALNAKIATIEGLIEAIEASRDEATRDASRALTAAVLDLHATALERILAVVARAPAGEALAAACGDDPVIAAVLKLHGLHPSPLASRVARAVAEVRETVVARGGDVVLLGVEGGAARIRVEGPARALAARGALEEAIAAAAPDLEALTIDEVEAPVLVQLRTPAGPSRKVV